MECRKGIIKGGVFYESGSSFSFVPIIRKGLVIPEGVEIFLNINYHVAVEDYVLVDQPNSP